MTDSDSVEQSWFDGVPKEDWGCCEWGFLTRANDKQFGSFPDAPIIQSIYQIQRYGRVSAERALKLDSKGT